MRIRNYTPHDLTLFTYEAQHGITFPSEGTVRAIEVDQPGPRLTIQHDGTEVVAPTAVRSYDGVEGVPEFGETTVAADRLRDGDILVVSLVALAAMRESGMVSRLRPWRVQVVAPDTGPGSVVRDDGGRILGVRAFVRPR